MAEVSGSSPLPPTIPLATLGGDAVSGEGLSLPIWIPLALLFPALTGVVNILDKLIVDRYTPRIYYYAFWIGAFELVLGLISLGVVAGVQGHGLEFKTLLGGIITGVVAAVSVLLFFAALKLGQVTRVVPIWFLYPLMVAPMAAVFLDESISGLAAGAIGLAVIGAVLVSWQGGGDGPTFGNPAVPLLALAAAAFLAVSFILSKYFLEDGDFWQFLASERLGVAVPMMCLALLPGVWRGAWGMVRHRGFMGLVALVQAIITLVLLVRFAAIDQGPVSFVAAISAVQPAVVFFYALALAALYPAIFGPWITRRTLVPQMTGIAALTAGVVIISLQG